ncbi:MULTISPECIES: metallophosphoesterase [unclassified Pseudomonas]|uniref:metallophosphoesterase family protein n=1 Tax=unclassified Pseudomonas TaxID=196821 RepID=UPI00128E6881|nr:MULTISPECIES: metallophosphoesterase [unclassified Pseudomonas]MPQ70014.1 metallophosphoesterase [Pseudomonas sp. MWU12-2323]
MNLPHLEHELAKIRVRLSGLKARLELSWKKLTSDIEPEEFQAIQALLQRGHDQAQYVLDHGDLPTDEPAVPWELSHGLSILHMGNAKALPTSESQLQTRVLKDGTLLGCRKWELLDLLWSEALIKWIENLRRHAPFATTPMVMMIDNDVTLAIAGDWGTGPFESHAPAVNVAKQMQLAQADFTIHLGDVYYAGTGSEEDVDMAGWPMGKHGAFTLNSNHEMYSGAHGYFAELNSRFPMQQGTSYFALYNDDWLIVGLDSAYASAPLGLYMDGTLNQQQIDWMKSLPKGKKLLVLSHHQGFDISGANKTTLYQPVCDALGRVPDYWYWGHLHNGIVYAEQGGLRARCAGHGAIPYGVTSELDGNERVLFSEVQNAMDDEYPERVLNGYVKVRLSGENIIEEFIGEDGSVRWASHG